MSVKMFGFMQERGAGTIRIFRFPIAWAGSNDHGTWWFGVGRWRLQLKAPWNSPIFSERNGYSVAFLRMRGWRVFSFVLEARFR